jgi:hypothetical protein
MIGHLLCWLGLDARKLYNWPFSRQPWFVGCKRPGCYWTKEVRR